MILLIAYDLHAPGRDYPPVAELIETADSCVHPQESLWLIDTRKSCADWRDALAEACDANDEFYVVELRHNWASRKLDKAAVAWLKDPNRSWS